eukprot:CAMPEP_0172688940 /NCGR_PEP_ID=MMETSP1074-20121228/22791_1 /TAXON_ID=2916 /ORGANISM="Ceratium fusus, Strain PA161109" /LENGTH=294 /DNA_ID=CAMNT_0013508673 /DNA_START=32 /DNA_END=916 /DNA_ORIENTATION=-
MAGDPHVDVDRILRTVMVLRSATESLEHSSLLRTRHTFIEVVDGDEIGSVRRSQSCRGSVMVRERELSLDEPPLKARTSPNAPQNGVHAGQEAQLDVESVSTNLYVGFLTPDWTEDLLGSEFGHFGTVTSVKIMYPRTERQRLRGMNCGFVQFTSREEAERAKAHVDGKEYFGTCIRIGWGKAVQPKSPAGDSNEAAVVQRAKEVRKAGGSNKGGQSPRSAGGDRVSEDGLSSQSTGPPSSSASGSPTVHRTPLLRMGSRYKRRIRLLKMRGERQQQLQEEQHQQYVQYQQAIN